MDSLCLPGLMETMRFMGDVIELISPPYPITKSFYRCEKVFLVEDLEKLVTQQRCHLGVVMIDDVLSYWTYSYGKLEKRGSTNNPIPRKHNKGGSSSNRYQNIRLTVRDQMVNDIYNMCSSIFADKGQSIIDHIIFSGSNDLFVIIDKKFEGSIFSYSYKFAESSPEGIKYLCNSFILTVQPEKKIDNDIATKVLDLITLIDERIVYGPQQIVLGLHLGYVDYLIYMEVMEAQLDLIKEIIATGIGVIDNLAYNINPNVINCKMIKLDNSIHSHHKLKDLGIIGVSSWAYDYYDALEGLIEGGSIIDRSLNIN